MIDLKLLALINIEINTYDLRIIKNKIIFLYINNIRF